MLIVERFYTNLNIHKSLWRSVCNETTNYKSTQGKKSLLKAYLSHVCLPNGRYAPIESTLPYLLGQYIEQESSCLLERL